MRLPNGFGQISKIKNRKLRNPFRAMITTGVRPDGRPIQSMLKPKAYFHTYQEAYEALLEYHRKNDPNSKDKTLEELFVQWTTEHYKNISLARQRTIDSAWKYLEPIKGRLIRSLRILELKNFLENLQTTPNMKIEAKLILNGIYKYAVQYEYVDSNIIANITISDKAGEQEHHIPYTSQEVDTLWTLKDNKIAQIILIQCYSGWRPDELLGMEIKNINLDDGYMVGGSKTDAGKNRIVPIHPKIKELVEKNYELAKKADSKYLFFTRTKNKHDYSGIRVKYTEFLKKNGLNPEHRMHDGRVHFVTACKEYNVDEYAIKRMVGHAIKDITENIYTKRNLKWLRTEIEKIK